MTLDEVRTLFDYDAWADGELLRAARALTADQYARDLGSSFGGVRGTLLHVYGADRVWLARWQGDGPSAPWPVDDLETLDQLEERWAALRLDTERFLAALTEAQLTLPMPYTDYAGQAHRQLLFQQMQHRINHSTYHRGQVVTMLRQLGAEPVSTDLIKYYRQKAASLP